ncbi:hypothetical protein GYMLUDRAFT_235903 [Collybiopsis luxurians FD-317 M1]|nr:hypothetical protein GYMLUDRAFT_235903 [Collybiopsis luxurians FD-317 M1]
MVNIPTKDNPSSTLPPELWLPICALLRSRRDICNLTRVCRSSSGAAYTVLYRRLFFRSAIQFRRRMKENWHNSVEKLAALPRSLSFGFVIVPLDYSRHVPHSPNWDTFKTDWKTIVEFVPHFSLLTQMSFSGIGDIGSEVPRMLAQLKALNKLEFIRCCFEDGTDFSVFDYPVTELVMDCICWHGENQDSMLIQRCSKVKYLTFTWHPHAGFTPGSASVWYSITLKRLTVRTTSWEWKWNNRSRAEHKESFLWMICGIYGLRTLVVANKIPNMEISYLPKNRTFSPFLRCYHGPLNLLEAAFPSHYALERIFISDHDIHHTDLATKLPFLPNASYVNISLNDHDEVTIQHLFNQLPAVKFLVIEFPNADSRTLFQVVAVVAAYIEKSPLLQSLNIAVENISYNLQAKAVGDIFTKCPLLQIVRIGGKMTRWDLELTEHWMDE